jgi:hypothetical protein
VGEGADVSSNAFEVLHRVRTLYRYSATFRGSRDMFLSAAAQAVPELPSWRPLTHWELDGHHSQALFLQLPDTDLIRVSLELEIEEDRVTLKGHTYNRAVHALLLALVDQLSRLLVREA